MRASSCVTLPGATHTSIEYSPVALIRSCSLLLAAVEPCALPRADVDAPAADPGDVAGEVQVQRRLDAAGVVGDAARAGLELVQGDHVRRRSGCRRSATVPSYSVSAFDSTSDGSTCVSGTCVGEGLDRGLHLVRVRRRSRSSSCGTRRAGARPGATCAGLVEVDLDLDRGVGLVRRRRRRSTATAASRPSRCGSASSTARAPGTRSSTNSAGDGREALARARRP